MPSGSFSKKELRLIKKLNTSQKIQDFLNKIPIVGHGGDRCRSPKVVLLENRAHCMEGAMLGAFLLSQHGFKPLVVDIKSTKNDFDHVIAVFKQNGYWGALSKTNHAVLRYREPVYKTIRELVMSYFHEYFLDSGKKTMRSFSRPVNLSRFNGRGWRFSVKDVWYIPIYLDKVRHYPVLTKAQIKHLRRADKIEIKAGKLKQWPSGG